MAFWCRLRQTKLISSSNQFKICYFQIQNCTASHPRIGVLERLTSVIHKSQIEFGYNVRFFAAPVQANPKKEEKDTTGPRLNEKITAEFIRLVTEEGHGIVSRRDALERARRLNLDLVEVQRNAKPPVCKLADYHKEKYKQQTKEKDRAKSKSDVTLRKGDCKEVRFSGKTEQKDLQMKADTVKRLMDRGYRVKCMAMGTEDQDLGGLLSRLSALIEDVSIVESGPRVEKKQAYVIVRHVKFGPSKKGSGKKIPKVVGATSPEVRSDATSPLNPAVLNQSPIQSEDIMDPESEFERDEEIRSEEAETPTWSAFEANDDFDTVFDIGFETKTGKYSGDVQMNPAPNRFSDSRSRPVIEPVRRETVVSSPVEPRTNYPPPKPMDGNSYGIFSASKVNDTPDKNGLPPEVNNRYKKGNAFNSRTQTSSRGVSENPNMPLSNTNRGGRPGFDNGEQGKWGIFSTESSKVRR